MLRFMLTNPAVFEVGISKQKWEMIFLILNVENLALFKLNSAILTLYHDSYLV